MWIWAYVLIGVLVGYGVVAIIAERCARRLEGCVRQRLVLWKLRRRIREDWVKWSGRPSRGEIEQAVAWQLELWLREEEGRRA